MVVVVGGSLIATPAADTPENTLGKTREGTTERDVETTTPEEETIAANETAGNESTER